MDGGHVLMNNLSRALIGIYAGSLRPGGGLTVLNQMIGALAHDNQLHLVIYTGASDTTEEVKTLASAYPKVEVVEFLPRAPAFLRNLASKFLFVANRRSRRFACLITFNYFLPANCPSITYHINLLSFQKADKDTCGAWLKRLDAGLACRYANVNIFESNYLLDQAKSSASRINQPEVLYIGVHPDFYQSSSSAANNADIMLVSSMQPHKDNSTCLQTLRILAQKRPEIPWRLVVAGGQSADQWNDFIEEARQLGIAGRIEIAGRMNRAELSRRMNLSLCLVSASRIESFCMVALESMASRCPAIITNATSMPESAGDAAVIVEPGNAQQFADACIAFHDDPKFRAQYVAAGIRRAAQFTAEQFRANLYDLLANKVERVSL